MRRSISDKQLQSYMASDAQFAWVEANATDHYISPEEEFIRAEERVAWDLGYPVGCIIDEGEPGYHIEYDYTIDGRCSVDAVLVVVDDDTYTLGKRMTVKQSK